MKIIIIPSWYPSKKDAINGSFFREQAIALSKFGHEVIVLNATFQGRDNYFDKDNWHLRVKRGDGITEYSFTIPGFGIWRIPYLASCVFTLTAKRVFKAIMRNEGKADIIHVHSFYPAGKAALKLTQKNHIPLVYTEHSSGVILNNLTKYQKKLLSECIEHSDRCIAVSRRLADCMMEYGIGRRDIEIVPNMVNESFFSKYEKRQNTSFTFVCVGRLDSNKKVDSVIMAAAKLKALGKHFAIRIIGDGDEREKLISLSKELNLAGEIAFLGQCSREKVVEELHNSDAFILLSSVETFGIVYIEAMASGLPLIMPREIAANLSLPDKVGISADTSDCENIVQAMDRMINEIECFNRDEISQLCYERYSEKSVCEKLNEIYCRIR